MAILPGKRLGPDEILSAIGAGGLYRARDTRPDRIVAIKALAALGCIKVPAREVKKEIPV